MAPLLLFWLVHLVVSVSAQQIWDIWQTTWDRNKLFTRQPTSQGLPINFGPRGPAGSADILVDDTQIFQSMDGFGASLTDSSAKMLDQLKSQDWNNYWNLINQLFSPTYAAATAGLTAVRVPIGSTDFSDNLYSFDDTANDFNLDSFSDVSVPSYVWSTLSDIFSVSPIIKIFILPWSAPWWMKNNFDMRGDSFNPDDITVYANYLFRAVQDFQSRGFTPYAVAIQNEPENSNPTYPTALVPANVEASIAQQLRSLLDNNGLSGVKILGYEHNWDDVNYPESLMNQAGDSFAGAAFHCYAGGVKAQSSFHNAFPAKEIYHTECSGTLGTDWWSNIKWYMDNLFIGAPENWARTAMMWNFALDSGGNPLLPGTNSCGGGCRPIATIPGDGSYFLNEEYYVMAHASRAVIPKDPGGPFAQRVGVTVRGQLNWALRVGAYRTGRAGGGGPPQWTIVVLNWDDFTNGNWNPTPVHATIEFRGQQASFTFPVGITTLWWFA